MLLRLLLKRNQPPKLMPRKVMTRLKLKLMPKKLMTRLNPKRMMLKKLMPKVKPRPKLRKTTLCHQR